MAKIHPACYLDLPTEQRAVRKHGRSPQPESLREGRSGRQAATGAETETQGLPPPSFLPHSLRLHPTLCSSQNLGLKFSVPRKGNSQGSPKPLLKSCPLPSLPSPLQWTAFYLISLQGNSPFSLICSGAESPAGLLPSPTAAHAHSMMLPSTQGPRACDRLH